MHIVIDAREWSSTTGRYISRLVQELELLDLDNEYSILMYPKDIDSWQPTNPHFSKVPCPHKEFTLDEQFGLKRQLDALKPDLVHFAMVQQPVWYRGKTVTTMNDLTTIRFKNPSKNPLIFTFKQQVYKWVNKRVARKANALITYTEFVKDDVVGFTGVRSEKITVVPLAAEPLSTPVEAVTVIGNEHFLLYVGRPMPHKNLPRLVESFALLKPQHPDLKLVLAGRRDALYDQIVALVEQQQIPDVIFTDFISDGQLRWLYEHCAAYVVPSLSEGFGLPGLEAMAQGAPVVSSNATCLPEVYGDAAVYFDPRDSADMAQKLTTVLDSSALRAQLVAAGLRQAASYSWRRTAEQTLALYTELLSSS